MIEEESTNKSWPELRLVIQYFNVSMRKRLENLIRIESDTVNSICQRQRSKKSLILPTCLALSYQHNS